MLRFFGRQVPPIPLAWWLLRVSQWGTMDFSAIGSSLGTALGAEAPRILGAIVILIIGWIVDGCSLWCA